jgi:hypothetical protein
VQVLINQIRHYIEHWNTDCEPFTWTANTGAAWIRGCNQGEYQMWEVFETTVNGAKKYTFKSWGAWTLQGRHRCLTTTGEWAQEVLAECHADQAQQQWQ